MGCLFSIIVPVYNVKEYVGICINSILNQHFWDYELIMVDDCSTDGSLDIVKALASKNSSIKIIEHERNLSQGGARNTGVRAAKGTYLIFLDSDDIMLPDYLDKLSKIITNKEGQHAQIDVIITLPYVFNNNTHEIYSWIDKAQFHSLPHHKIITAKNYPALYSLELSAWRKVFSRDFFINKNLFFPEQLKFEDFAHHFKTLYLASNIIIKPIDSILYRIGRPNQTTSSKDRRCLDICPVMKDGYLFFAEGDCNPQEVTAYLRWCIKFCMWQLTQVGAGIRDNLISELYLFWKTVKISSKIRQHLSAYEKTMIAIFQNRRKFHCFFKYDYRFLILKKLSKKILLCRLILGKLYE